MSYGKEISIWFLAVKDIRHGSINQSSDILQHSQNRPTGDRWLKF